MEEKKECSRCRHIHYIGEGEWICTKNKEEDIVLIMEHNEKTKNYKENCDNWEYLL